MLFKVKIITSFTNSVSTSEYFLSIKYIGYYLIGLKSWMNKLPIMFKLV